MSNTTAKNRFGLDEATLEMLDRTEYRVAALRNRADSSDEKPDTSCYFCQCSGEEEYKCDALDKLYCKIEKCRFYKTPETVAEEKKKEEERKKAKAKKKASA